MKNILITGATGFIGQHLVRAQLADDNHVKALVRKGNPGIDALEQKGVEVIIGDITDYPSVKRAVKDVHTVYHLAAMVSDWGKMSRFRTVNVEGMKHVCEASLKEGVKLLVNISTSDVFGHKEDVELDENSPYSYWNAPYPDTKIEAAKIGWEYYEKGLPLTTIHPTWVFGPGDKTLTPLVADAIRKRELIFWRKNAVIWMAFIENLIDLIMTVSKDPRAVGEAFIVHDGTLETFQQFSAKIAERLKLRTPKLHIPFPLAMSAAWIMEKLWKLFRRKLRPLLTVYSVRNFGSCLKISAKKAESVLGWKPPVPYEVGLQRTLDWLETMDKKQLKKK